MGLDRELVMLFNIPNAVVRWLHAGRVQRKAHCITQLCQLHPTKPKQIAIELRRHNDR